MGLIKREYTANETVITAKNLNDIQDTVIMLEDGLFSVDNDKNGTSITMTDAAYRGFRRFNIYGKTIQDGTPTLDAPVELVSLGNSGSITVSVASGNGTQNMTINTPNGLPGIPVTTGGNYTDTNGQEWICDEIDLARGVYVQRLACETVTLTFAEEDSAGRFRQIAAFKNLYKSGNSPCFCNIAEWQSFSNVDNSCCVAAYGFYYRQDSYTLDEINSKIGGAPISIVAVLDTPRERPLPEEELTAYAALHTYRNDTTVTNDAGAHMGLEYAVDAKKHLERTFVKTVNNIAPDEAGNVDIGGLLVVAKPDGDYMSHASKEINDHIINGGTAVLRVEKYGYLVDLPVCYNREACVAFIYNDTESRTTEQYVIYADGTWESFGVAALGIMDVTLVDGRATHTSQAIHDHASQGGMVRLLIGDEFLSLTHSSYTDASFVYFSAEDGSLIQYIIYEDGTCDQFTVQM